LFLRSGYEFKQYFVVFYCQNFYRQIEVKIGALLSQVSLTFKSIQSGQSCCRV
jgi:hypothetical protein